jgi:hypothetical protein
VKKKRRVLRKQMKQVSCAGKASVKYHELGIFLKELQKLVLFD